MKILCDNEIYEIAKKEFEYFFDDETMSRKFSNGKNLMTLKDYQNLFNLAFKLGYDKRQQEEIKDDLKKLGGEK